MEGAKVEVVDFPIDNGDREEFLNKEGREAPESEQYYNEVPYESEPTSVVSQIDEIGTDKRVFEMDDSILGTP
jgi:hypothetical protein